MLIGNGLLLIGHGFSICVSFKVLGVDADGRDMPAECSLLSARRPKSVDSSNG